MKNAHARKKATPAWSDIDLVRNAHAHNKATPGADPVWLDVAAHRSLPQQFAYPSPAESQAARLNKEIS